MLSLFTICNSVNAATITVTGDQNLATKVNRIITNQTWTANNEYKLDGLITVGSGVTLTIEPGTVVRGMNAISTLVDLRPGTLIIEKGGKLIANGSATNPIVFTDEWDDHMPWKTGTTGTVKTRTWRYQFNNNAGQNLWQTKTDDAYDYGSIGDHHGAWGGIVLCGKAFLNMDDTTLGAGTIKVEGTDVSLGLNGGGSDDSDSSGELSYVQIRYGGSVLANGSEINGLTMYGVGRGTKLHHIEVYNNQDDMIEWFGGCVNGKYLVAWGAGDDIFDSDTGYRGKNQFLFGVQRDLNGGKIESGASDKGMEMDGGEKKQAAMAQLFSASVWANVTLIGNQFTGVAKPADSTRNIAISMRDNASPRIYNSIFMDFSSVATMIENRESDAAWTVNGIKLSPSMRFQTPSTLASLPADTYNGGATAGMSSDQIRSYFYGDGVLADELQACIRGAYFWNFNTNNTASSSSGLWPTATGSTWSSTYPWTSSSIGSGPWVSGASDTAYQGWNSSTNRNTNQTGKNTEANTLTADATNLLPIQYRHRVAQTRTVCTSFNLNHVDPRAANAARVSATAVADQWLTPVRFQGAFAPESNWAKGWTAIGTLKSTNAASSVIYGVFGASSVANSIVADGDVTTGGSVSTPAAGTTTVITNTITTVITNGVNGIVYQTASLITDTGLNSVAAAGLQTSPVLTYTIATAGTYQLQSTPSLSSPTWTVEKTFSVSAGDVPVTVNLTDILAEPAASSMFYKLLKQ
jgi:hypothetical protein